jgi:hypothetical protein
MNVQNKIFICEATIDVNIFGGKSHFVITVAASNAVVAKQYVKDEIGIDAEPTWLMSASYPTIYNQTGTTPKSIQAKILSNCTFHTDFKL